MTDLEKLLNTLRSMPTPKPCKHPDLHGAFAYTDADGNWKPVTSYWDLPEHLRCGCEPPKQS